MTPISFSDRAELRAIKLFTLTHVLGLVGFVLIMIGFFWYLNYSELQEQRAALYRDIEWAQQSMRLKLRENQEEIAASISDWDVADESEPLARARIREFLLRNPTADYIAMIDADKRVLWVLPANGIESVMHRTPGEVIRDSVGRDVFDSVSEQLEPSFSEPFLGDDAQVMIELHTPVVRNGNFQGSLAVGYSLARLLTFTLAPQVRERYQVSITDSGGNPLVSTSPRTIHDSNLAYELPLEPPGHGIRLRANVFETRPKRVESILLIAVIGLSAVSLASLVMLWRHARRRLEAEAERDRLFRLSQDLMCVLDEKGRMLRVNPAFQSLFGVPDPGVLLSDLVHADDRPLLLSSLASATRSRAGPVAIEARFRHGDDWRWLNWSVRGDPDDAGAALYAVAHDVTKRHNAETALAAEIRFREAMEDSMLTGMRAFDMQGRVTYVNQAFCSMLGYSCEDLIGSVPPYPYWPGEDRERHYEHLAMILRGDAPAEGFDVALRRKDGTKLDSRMYVSPLVDRQGRQTGWMTSITDITESKRVREELAAAHERFTTVLDELDAAVWVVALPDAPHASDGPPLFTNRMFRHLFGADGARLRLPGIDGSAVGWLPREILQPSLGRWFEVRARRIRWVDGNPVRMLVATDVTRRHEAEELQRQQDHKLQRTSRLVTMGEMASSLAHELNQPLTAIANYCMGLSTRIRARVARNEPFDAEELLEALGKTAAQAERAGMVIHRIREFVRRSEPERRICQVPLIVADAVGLAEIDAQRYGVRIEVELPIDLPQLNADPILIEQVLLNLLKNGIDAMRDSAGRELHVAVIRHAQAIEFAVADAGRGLDPAARDKLFEPFFTTKSEGMGMGLNICRSIVESHGGRLWVESRDGEGCTFRFTIPLPAGRSVHVAEAA